MPRAFFCSFLCGFKNIHYLCGVLNSYDDYEENEIMEHIDACCDDDAICGSVWQ